MSTVSLQNSFLAQPKYGYDTVVGVTQKALNSAIEYYYSHGKGFTPVSFYFIKDASGNPLPIDQHTLLANYTSGIDPLSKSALSPADQKTLSTSSFYFGFTFTIGNPKDYAAVNYLTLKPGSNSVRYYLLCFELQVAFLNPDNKTWVGFQQSLVKEFNIYADINLKNVLDNSNLPSQVQAAVDTLGGTGLNIQQLIFDLDSAVIDPSSTLKQLDNTCSVFKPLMQEFAKAYFSTYTAQSGALNYAITTQNNASLVPTQMDWYVGGFVDGNGDVYSNPTMDQQNLATLNYLFASNGDPLPAGAQLNWNWLDDNGSSHNPNIDTNSDVNKYDGVISINRDALAKYFQSQLNSYVSSNCLRPNVYLWNSKTDTFSLGMYGAKAAAPQAFMPYQSGSSSGEEDVLLFYNHTDTSSASGTANASDTASVDVAFTLKLIVKDQMLSIVQTCQMHIKELVANVPYETWPVIMELSDSFSINIDDHGVISFQLIPELSFSTNNPNIHPIHETLDYNKAYQEIGPKNIQQVPVTMPAQFVFPGGNAFTFQDVQFSATSDLVCYFTYKAQS